MSLQNNSLDINSTTSTTDLKLNTKTTAHEGLFNTPYPSDPTFSSNILDSLDPNNNTYDLFNPPSISFSNTTEKDNAVKNPPPKKNITNEQKNVTITNTTEKNTTENKTVVQSPPPPQKVEENKTKEEPKVEEAPKPVVVTPPPKPKPQPVKKTPPPPKVVKTPPPPPPQPVKKVTREKPVKTVIVRGETCNSTLAKINENYDLKPMDLIRYYSTFFVIIFGTSYLTLRLLLAFHRRKTDRFLKKGISILCVQTLLLFVCISFAILLYTLGTFDTYLINWEAVFNGLGMFCVLWILFSLMIIYLLYLMSIENYRNYEENTKNFKNLKEDYHAHHNKDHDKKQDSAFMDMFEYLSLKRSFVIPLYPIFKAKCLYDFNFAKYLEYCMLRTLKSYFKFSWFSWIFCVGLICLWGVVIAPGTLTYRFVIMIITPIITMIVLLFVYLYAKHIYRKTVDNISEANYNDYEDFDHPSQQRALADVKKGTPLYMTKILADYKEGLNSAFDVRSDFNGYNSTFYEDTITFGNTGFYLIVNTVQLSGMVFISWTVLYWFFYNYQAMRIYGSLILLLVIPLYLLYLVALLFLICLCLKWYNLTSSIEMRRNEKALNKTLAYQYKESADMAQKIMHSFKILYFYMHKYGGNLQSEAHTDINVLDPKYHKLVDLLFINFKSISTKTINEDERKKLIFADLENYPIHSEELHSFFKSAGNNIKQPDIDFMKRLIEFNEKDTEGKMSYKHFREIWALMIYFSTKRPEDIIFYVFQNYLEENFSFEENANIKDVEINLNQMKEFFKRYEEYFQKEQVEFVMKECLLLDKTFTIGELIYVLITCRKYHPN